MTDAEDFLSARLRQKRIAIALALGSAVLSGVAIVVFVVLQSPSSQPDTPTEDPALAVLDCENGPLSVQQAQPCTDKRRFEDAYKALTTEALPKLEGSRAVDYVSKALDDLAERQQESVKAYDASDYSVAAEGAETALNMARTLLTRIEETYATAFARARTAFDKGDVDDANSQIDYTLAHKPGDPAATALKARIDRLPAVLGSLNAAKIAEAENDFPRLRTALREVLRLDPERTELRPKLESVERTLKEQDYRFAVREAREALNSEDLGQARVFATVAGGLYPNRPDVAQLIQDIEDAETDLRIERNLAEAQSLMTRDYWPDVRSRYLAVLADDPGNTEALNGVAKSEAILGAYDQAATLLDAPERLEDQGLRRLVARFLEANQVFEVESPILAESFSAVRARLADYDRPRRVVVQSDGKSDVQVRRVGKMGQFDTQEVFLAPGTYQFECSRKGFRSKIVPHTVPVTGDATTVVIECDVRI